jgi:hypothetical protein
MPTRSSFDKSMPSDNDHFPLAAEFGTAIRVLSSSCRRFRADIIERIMCDLAVDLPRVSRLHGRDLRSAIIDRPRIENLIADGAVTMIDHRLSISDGAEFLVRSVPSAFDAHLARIPQQPLAARSEPNAPVATTLRW